jgi:hypothetical protein
MGTVSTTLASKSLVLMATGLTTNLKDFDMDDFVPTFSDPIKIAHGSKTKAPGFL